MNDQQKEKKPQSLDDVIKNYQVRETTKVIAAGAGTYIARRAALMLIPGAAPVATALGLAYIAKKGYNMYAAYKQNHDDKEKEKEEKK